MEEKCKMILNFWKNFVGKRNVDIKNTLQSIGGRAIMRTNLDARMKQPVNQAEPRKVVCQL